MAEDTGPSRPVYQPDEVMNALAQQPQPRSYNCERLLEAHRIQEGMVHALKAGVSTLDAADLFLLKYLRSLYLQVTALPGSIRYNQLEMSVVFNGLLAPFIQGIDIQTKRMEIGLPTVPDVRCDRLSEIVRAAGAAFCCNWHYLNFRHHQDAVASDDAALLYTTLTIKSLADQAVADSFDERARSLMSAEAGSSSSTEEAPVLTAAQLRWLMHWVRAELVGWFAGVQYLLGDERCQESWVAQQQDYLALLKQSPSDPRGYALYARACLRFQQTRPALIFATKGITVAEAQGEQLARSQLHGLRGVALLLGGGGEHYKPSEVAGCLRDARKAQEDALGWLPAPYHDLVTLHPEDTIIMTQVLGLVPPARPEVQEGQEEEEEGDEVHHFEVDEATFSQAMDAALADASDVKVSPAMYTTPTPRELPVGALTQLQQQAEEQQAAAAGAGAGSAGPRPSGKGKVKVKAAGKGGK